MLKDDKLRDKITSIQNRCIIISYCTQPETPAPPNQAIITVLEDMAEEMQEIVEEYCLEKGGVKGEG